MSKKVIALLLSLCILSYVLGSVSGYIATKVSTVIISIAVFTFGMMLNSIPAIIRISRREEENE